LARPVPTLVLTETHTGTPQIAETGDHVEVRLPEAADVRWTLSKRSGDTLLLLDEHVEIDRSDRASETPMRVFRFSTTVVGRFELVFINGARSLTFVVEVR
jgi:hypothetical protein